MIVYCLQAVKTCIRLDCQCFGFVLSHANCTPFFNRSTKIVIEKNRFFAILKVLFSTPSQKMHFSSSLPILLLFSGGSKNYFSVQIRGLTGHFTRKKHFVG